MAEQYLVQWRMQVAATLLSQGSSKTASVGTKVDYDSEPGFSRAFKKAVGLSPGAWRGARAASRRTRS